MFLALCKHNADVSQNPLLTAAMHDESPKLTSASAFWSTATRHELVQKQTESIWEDVKWIPTFP